MTRDIHSTAIVHRGAVVAEGVSIGAYSVVEEDVVICDNCEIGPYVRVAAGTRIGRGCRIFQGAALGSEPQDLKFAGEKTLLRIGDYTTIREGCTLNRGTKATGETVLGSHCYLMAYSHVAHDCVVGDHFVAANNCNLAGHVKIGDHVVTGGVAGIAQFCQIGDHCFLGAYSRIFQDVVPFSLVAPNPMRVAGVNKVGLLRAGFEEPRRRQIQSAYKILFRSGLPCGEALRSLENTFSGNPDVRKLVAFVRNSRRSLLRMAYRKPPSCVPDSGTSDSSE